MSNSVPPSDSVNYSNSHKKKEAEKQEVKKVTKGQVVERKKSLGRKFSDLFVGDDAQTVGEYLVQDVLVPALKNLISDAVGQGIDRFLFGGSGRGYAPSSRGRGHTGYNTMYSGSKPVRDRRDSSRELSSKARASHDFSEIILESRGDAEQIIDNLIAILEEYDVATVADLYSLAGITPSFVDNKWGWNDLRTADVRRVREGYLLVLPRVMDIG